MAASRSLGRCLFLSIFLDYGLGRLDAPKTEDEDTSKAFAVHYKGARKQWMLRHLHAELG